MVQKWRWMSAAVVVAVGLATLITASPAAGSAASPSGAAGRAKWMVSELDHDLDTGSLAPNERRCLMHELTARPKLTREAVATRSMRHLRPSSRAALYRMIASCAPTTALRQVGGLGEAFDGLDVPAEEARCLVQGLAELDDAVLIAAAENSKKIDRLSDDGKQQVLELDMRCLPTPIGETVPHGLFQGMGVDDPHVSPVEARCVGQALAGPFVEAGPSVLTGATTPQLEGAVIRAAVECAPDLIRDGFTAGFVGSGVPESVAACMAQGLVADPSLVEAIAGAEANGAEGWSLIEELATSCAETPI